MYKSGALQTVGTPERFIYVIPRHDAALMVSELPIASARVPNHPTSRHNPKAGSLGKRMMKRRENSELFCLCIKIYTHPNIIAARAACINNGHVSFEP